MAYTGASLVASHDWTFEVVFQKHRNFPNSFNYLHFSNETKKGDGNTVNFSLMKNEFGYFVFLYMINQPIIQTYYHLKAKGE